MLLRSSSTPLLGSLHSDSPTRISHHEISSLIKHPSSPFHSNLNSKISFHQPGFYHLSTVSCTSSPISPAVSEFSDRGKSYRSGLLRTRSDGNLEILSYVSEVENEDQILQSIPSFSLEEEESDEEDDIEEEDDFCQIRRFTNMVTTNQELLKVGFEKERDSVNQNMYQTIGIGVDGGDGVGAGGGGRRDFSSGDNDHNGHGVEDYYKKMVDENPGNPLFLRNYAQFLYQANRNLPGAEEYYSRAILADPNDGEVLSQYAKLVWELHRDQERASSYFERAVQASPHDSHVHAAYAYFLFETEEEEEDCCVAEEAVNVSY